METLSTHQAAVPLVPASPPRGETLAVNGTKRPALNPFARSDLWQAFRFVGYFQRETVAVFARSVDAENFCLANIGGEHGNGYFVASYRRAS